MNHRGKKERWTSVPWTVSNHILGIDILGMILQNAAYMDLINEL